MILVAILFLVVRRFVQASPALRRVLGPVLGAGALAVAAPAARARRRSSSATSAGSRSSTCSWRASGWCRSRSSPASCAAGSRASAAGDLLLELGRGRPLREALADALHDPSLEIAYWLPERERFVSAEGKEIRDDGSRTALLRRARRPRIAALLHDPSLAYDPELVEAVAAAAGLWLENERLPGRPALAGALPRHGRQHVAVAALRARPRRPDRQLQHRLRQRERPRGSRDDPERVLLGRLRRARRAGGAARRFAAGAPDHLPIEFESTFVNERGDGALDRVADRPDRRRRRERRGTSSSGGSTSPSASCARSSSGASATSSATSPTRRRACSPSSTARGR